MSDYNKWLDEAYFMRLNAERNLSIPYLSPRDYNRHYTKLHDADMLFEAAIFLMREE